MRKISYNYAFVFYDVNEKRVQKVFKICKKYLTHIQNSVFEGELSEGQMMQLKIEIKQYLREDMDSCIIFKGRNDIWMKKEFVIKEEDKTSTFL